MHDDVSPSAIFPLPGNFIILRAVAYRRDGIYVSLVMETRVHKSTATYIYDVRLVLIIGNATKVLRVQWILSITIREQFACLDERLYVYRCCLKYFTLLVNGSSN